MNSSQLECFVEVASNLSFAKASKLLHLTQPAVSKKIHSLEEELGVLLFVRDTRNVNLTYAGRQFFPNAKSILLQEKNAIAHLSQLDSGHRKSLLIGSYHTDIYTYLDQILYNVFLEMPEIRPDIILAPFQPLSTLMSTNSIDIILGIRELLPLSNINSARYNELSNAPFYCIFSEKIIKTNSKIPDVISSKDIINNLLSIIESSFFRISYPKLEVLQNQNAELRNLSNITQTLLCNDRDAAVCLVKSGIGFAIAPKALFMKDKQLIYIPISDFSSCSYGYFYNLDNDNPALSLFINELHNYFSK